MKGTVTMKGKRYYPVFDINRDPATGKRRQKWGPGFKTKRDAENWLTETVSQVNKGIYIIRIKETVREWCEDWLETYAAIHLRPNVKDSYSQMLRNHLIPYLGAKPLSALTANDLDARYADMIGLSFVKEPGDVEQLQAELAKRTSREIGIVLKVETKIAFENLSRLLLVGLRKPPLGVMVARGDLGVEIGFERMSEVQEQILWLCEAAHVPVIWATQVLEQMNKTGLPTRGEVTDAAMSSRAECVMLNKGPFIVETVRFLNNILMRMMDHNNKKTPMLRKLKISEGRWPGRRLDK